ncbi:glutamine cyclotransferase [Bacteroides sp. 214]|uniref:M20 family metallopeptidase n=1 Tax=Bacteroides sp. 214 TaxID=2302935 RepID=UPI0013D605C1|nr:M28 family peptidase [Bacteroides sp. 214]NDW13073.1 glutamine cyclotransferase [Bacteroides sp. 214]
MKIRMFLLLATVAILAAACKTNNKSRESVEPYIAPVAVPNFNADSAYAFVQQQVDFGPRVPNTKQHVACGEFLASQLAKYGATVTNQYVELIAFDGTILKARNIIGSYQPENRKRILLFAHWDTRPWSDADPDEKNHHKPVLGANDGASGVGVLLEVARLIQQNAPALGIDIIFFDAEDYGAPRFHKGEHKDEYWCLGSQYWARNPHVANYNARFGILLDMVGGKEATFHKEAYSERYAKDINRKVWDKARALGYGKTFVDARTGGVTDDHWPVNEFARIPSIDIVPHDDVYSFGNFWHTVNDTMDNIDRTTLKAVGQTVLAVIYEEK